MTFCKSHAVVNLRLAELTNLLTRVTVENNGEGNLSNDEIEMRI